jgi:hypothetical protein
MSTLDQSDLIELSGTIFRGWRFMPLDARAAACRSLKPNAPNDTRPREASAAGSNATSMMASVRFWPACACASVRASS